jgi:biotin operon repressor
MIYGRSQMIENRLSAMLRLIRSGGQSTRSLAEKLGISQPTVSRCLTALRERGYTIRSVREDHGWAYEVTREPATVSGQSGAKG